MTDDQKYLWMYCFYPPLRHRCLGVVSLDPENPFVRVFKEAVFWDATPLIAPEGDKVYFVGSYIRDGMICTIDVEGHIEEFARMDPEYIAGRAVYRFGTHLTLSSDGKYMLVDGMLGTHGFVAVVDMNTREFKIVNEYQTMHNHSQFSPINPKLFLIDQDWWIDPATGRRWEIGNRMWLGDTDATIFEPVIQRSWFEHDGSLICHDFWSQDGKVCWIDYAKGAYEMDVDTREMKHVWKHPLCHAHCNADRSLWVADQSPYTWKRRPCRVIFFNRKTEKTVDIYSNLPASCHDRDPWHIDPHPQFTTDGSYIVCTTTVRGTIDISITPVDQLVEMTN